MTKRLTVFICAVGALLLAAETPRKINFTVPLVGVDRKEMKVSDAKDAPPLTLGDVCVTALETMIEEDRQADGLSKFKRDQLARKIHGAKDVVLSVEDVELLKTRVGKVYGPAVIGAAWPLLDPAVLAPASK